MNTLKFSLFLCVSACGTYHPTTANIRYSDSTTSPTFIRTPFIPGFSESTPVVYQNIPMVVSFSRSGPKVAEFRDFSGNLIASHPWTQDLGCALTEGARMYLFGAVAGDRRASIASIYSDDLINWSAPRTVIEAADSEELFNCSVTKTPTGYVMAYELTEQGGESFSFRFLKSTDLINWIPEGIRYSLAYSACPTVRYIDGTYYVLFLEQYQGGWRTVATKTNDFINFNQSGTVFLAPQAGEGVNASDVDLVEYQGDTYITYIDGDQTTWGDVKMGKYSGTMKDLFLSLWP